MNQTLRGLFLFIFLAVFSFNTNLSAQCSGGVSGGNITPTTLIQTVAVPNAGLYYSFTGTAGVTYMFSFCSSEGGSAAYDTQITMLDGTGAYAGGYNDDWCGLQSYLTWVCPSNGTFSALITQYYCSVSGGSPAILAYRIEPPPNDDCSNATFITSTGTYLGSTAFANPDVAPSCVTTDGSGGGVWYLLTGNGNKVTASLCSGTNFDSRIRVFTGSCSGLVCETGDDNFCSTQSEVSWCTLNGVNYYILVHGSGAASGDFTLTMSEVVVYPPGIVQYGYQYCGSGTIQIDANGYPAFSWAPPTGLNTTTGPSVLASPTVTTTYTVSATDPVTGCIALNNATITVYPIPVVTVSASSNSICTGGSTNLTAGGASTYNWMPGNLTGASVSVSPATTTTYTVTGTSINGCTNTATVTINVNPLPVISASSSSPAICTGSFATLTGNGAVTYNWMPGSGNTQSFNVTPTSTTTYTLTGTDANGCSGTATINLTVNPLPIITAVSSSDTVCTGNVDTLTASGGLTYLWNNGHTTNPDFVAPNTTTTYTVTGTDANGCSNTGTVIVHALLSGPVTATSAFPSICSGSTDILSASGATTYNWMPGNISGATINVNPTSTTTYTVTGSSTNGCMKVDSITVNVNALPVISANTSASPVCGGTSATLTASGASTYSWSPGNLNGNPVSVSPTTSTTYTVTGSDSNGCSNTATVALIVFPAPNVTASANPLASCSGNPVTLTATGAITYSWTPGNLIGSTVSVTPATTQTYVVTGTDANGCTDSYGINVSVLPGPSIICYAAQTNVCTNDASVLLYGMPTGGTWSGPGVSGGNFIPSTAGNGTHVLTYSYTDSNGCTNTGTTTIVVSACVGVNENASLGGIYFYPNPNDGSFTINVSADGIHEMQMQIVDLQGRVVYAEIMEGINAGFTKNVNLTSLANGAYYMKFTSANSTLTEKLIIQK